MASELASELKRYLAGDPILSRPAGAYERFVRLCRRKPAEIALSISICIAIGLSALLFLGIPMTSGGGRVTSEQSRNSNSDIMLLFAATGPLFSACRIVGPQRLRVLETWLFTAILPIARLLLRSSILFLQTLVMVSFLLLGLVGKAISKDPNLDFVVILLAAVHILVLCPFLPFIFILNIFLVGAFVFAFALFLPFWLAE